ncbi:MAG: ATP-binding cassette domain-containing protein [Armatimonadia bacterium]|nr:ATP-binding cassette domain-containing protein [Armatimonadia bacterium]
MATGPFPLVDLREVWKCYRRHHDRPARIKDAFIARLFGHTHEVEETWAVRDLTLRVEPGEIVGLIGPNGCGKTTVLSIVAGVLEASRGEVRVDGRVCPMLQAGAGFHRDLTGLENVYLSGAILGMGRGEIDHKLDDIVAWAGAEDWIDTPVRTFSSGMLMRLGFSVAAHMEPDILIVDEILATGDEAFRAKVRDRLRREASDGRIVLFVSHYMEEIQMLCDRVVWMEDGKRLRAGPTDELVEQYITEGRSDIDDEDRQ